MEDFRDIAGLDGRYQIDRNGVIRTTPRSYRGQPVAGRIVTNEDAIGRVMLIRAGKKAKIPRSRLHAMTWPDAAPLPARGDCHTIHWKELRALQRMARSAGTAKA